jgi:CheY-like chemotaxis protein/DNA-binding XRE family transcriptional regulator
MFGAAVRVRRNQLGFSQEKLAEMAQLHRTYVSDVERGVRNVSLESIERLAQALKISVSTLFPRPELPGGKKVNGDNPSIDLMDILLVEDNLNDVELTMHAFKKARLNNRVHVVNDGAKALDFVFCRGEYARGRAEARLLLILLDLRLPRVSGLDVLRRLKADKRTQKIPVVILTVSQDVGDVEECIRLGAQNYIVKPVDFQRFSRATPQLNLNWALLKPPESRQRKTTN